MTYIAQTNEIPWICPEFHVCHTNTPKSEYLMVPVVTGLYL